MVMVLIFSMLLVSNVYAGTVGDDVVSILQQTFFPVITAFLIGVATIAINKIAKKFGAEATLANNALIERAVVQGIGLAEEIAAKAIKNKVDAKINGNDKLAIAVGHVKEMVPTITHEHAVSIIEGTLARIRGVGATGDKTI